MNGSMLGSGSGAKGSRLGGAGRLRRWLAAVAAIPATRVGSLPVWVRAPGQLGAGRRTAGSARRVRVRMLDRAAARRAGVNGVLFAVGRADAAAGRPAGVGVRLDYSGFAAAFGGSYGARLRLVRLPACVLSTPQLSQCRAASPVSATNDTEHHLLAADVDAAPDSSSQLTVLAATSGPSSDSGVRVVRRDRLGGLAQDLEGRRRLFTVLRNKAIDEWRKNRRQRPSADLSKSGHPAAEPFNQAWPRWRCRGAGRPSSRCRRCGRRSPSSVGTRSGGPVRSPTG